MADMIKVKSATGTTVSLFYPTSPFRKTWEKRGAVVPIERDKLIQLYYNSSLESALRNGTLIIEDKDFLYEVGYLSSPEEPITAVELTTPLMKRIISVMPLPEVRETLGKLSKTQISELVEYAVVNNGDLRMDRIDIMSKLSGKDVLKAIEMYKKDQED